MKKLLLVSAAMLTLPAMPVSADCATAGSTITCTGEIAGDLRNPADGLTVNVEAGAHILDEDDRDAIRVRGDGNIVNIRSGAVVESTDGDGLDGGNDLRVSNSGTVKAGNKGVDAEDKTGVTVLNYGSIDAYDKALRLGDGAYINNQGTIRSEIDEGVEAGDNAVVYNWGGAVIEASDDAIQVGENAYISNSGLIHSVRRGGDEADPQDGIDIDSGTIFNNNPGRIISDDDAAIDFDASTITSEIVNRGLIEGQTGIIVEKGEGGEPANTASQLVTNAATGTIVGRSGTALDLGAGDDQLKLFAGSQIEGVSYFGDDNDLLQFYGNSFDQSYGIESLFDGGSGHDSIWFGIESASTGAFTENTSYAFADILSLSLLEGIYGISLANASGGELSLFFTNWDDLRFKDGTFTMAELDQRFGLVAPVPLPAGVLLLGSSLVMLGAIRRRRATVAVA